MNDPITAIGLMSGTSMDGIDVATITTDGVTVVDHGPGHTMAYPAAFRERLGDAVAQGQALEAQEEAMIGDELARLHAEAIESLTPQPTATLIGFHGHTLWHAPEIGQTRQAGNGALLAALTGIDTVNDMRSADMHAGGQGAPLAPLYHAALAKGLPGPIAVLNLGGVGNLTFIDGEQVLAFDTGPGNAPLDDWVKSKAGLPFDEGGALAASGRVDEGLVASWRANPYFDQPPPKSLDRNAFQFDGLDRLNLEDGAATLAAFTIATVVDSRHHVPVKPIRWLVTGGGRHNAFLMAQLANQLGSPVEPVETVGWNGDLLEAQAFAFLAVRSRRGLPLTRPTTTGVSQPTVGGIFHPTEKSSKRS